MRKYITILVRLGTQGQLTRMVMLKDKKIDFFSRFFDEKSVFGGAGKDFWVENRLQKNR